MVLTAMRFSKCGLGVTGMVPPRRANFCSSDFCTLSVHQTDEPHNSVSSQHSYQLSSVCTYKQNFASGLFQTIFLN